MKRALALLPAMMLAVACTSPAAPAVAPRAPVTAPSPIRSTPPGVTVRAASWPAPDNHLTPGGLTPGCTTPRPQSQRSIGAAVHGTLDAAYDYVGKHGITNLEYDHRIPFALCGSNGADNVWPEHADGIRQTTYVHNEKDLLEDVIIAKWHAHKLTLTQAQNVFRGDWRVVWCRYVRTPGVDCSLKGIR